MLRSYERIPFNLQSSDTRVSHDIQEIVHSNILYSKISQIKVCEKRCRSTLREIFFFFEQTTLKLLIIIKNRFRFKFPHIYIKSIAVNRGCIEKIHFKTHYLYRVSPSVYPLSTKIRRTPVAIQAFVMIVLVATRFPLVSPFFISLDWFGFRMDFLFFSSPLFLRVAIERGDLTNRIKDVCGPGIGLNRVQLFYSLSRNGRGNACVIEKWKKDVFAPLLLFDRASIIITIIGSCVS